MQWEARMGPQLPCSFQEPSRTVPLVLAGWGVLWQPAASLVLALLHSHPLHRYGLTVHPDAKATYSHDKFVDTLFYESCAKSLARELSKNMTFHVLKSRKQDLP